MDGNVEDVLDQQPHTECNSGDSSDVIKEGIAVDKVSSFHAPDEAVEDTDNTASVQDDSDSELPCATPVTTSSEDTDENNAHSEQKACSEVNDQQEADICSVADDKPSLQVPVGESTVSDPKSQDHDETPATKTEPESTVTNNGEDEAKEVESAETKSQDVVDGADDDQTKPSNDEDQAESNNNEDVTGEMYVQLT